VIKKLVPKSTLAAMLLVTAAACAKSPVEGVYYADFASSKNPDVALAAKLEKMSLNVKGQQVTMEVSAMGKRRQLATEARLDGKKITVAVKEPEQETLVLVVKDERTLECIACSEGMPTIWKKQK
jgi:hypothetical protein